MNPFTLIYIFFRQIGTAFIFTVISLGGFLLSITVFPIIIMTSTSQDTKSKRVQKVLHYTFRLVTFLMRILCLVKLNKVNWEKIDPCDGQLIISNHPTLIDYVYLVSIFPQLDCVVKNDLWNSFFLRGVVRAAGYIKVDDPALFKKECLERLEAGRNLLIFPEGTRSDTNSLKPFKKGAASLIVSSTCKVMILTINCSPPILMKSQKWYKVPPKMAVLSITAQKQLERKELFTEDEKLIRAQANVNTYIWNYINSCL